jgi:hypothetical protein
MYSHELQSTLLLRVVFSKIYYTDIFNFIFYLVCEAIGTAATPGLLCQPRAIVKMIVEEQIECRLAGETDVLGENLPQRHFCPSQNRTWRDPGWNPGRRGGKPATSLLSYGAVSEILQVRFQITAMKLISNKVSDNNFCFPSAYKSYVYNLM